MNAFSWIMIVLFSLVCIAFFMVPYAALFIIVTEKRNKQITAAERLFAYNSLLDEIDDELDRIELSKERVRKALNRKGYAIPEGIRMDDWVGIIDERTPKEEL